MVVDVTDTPQPTDPYMRARYGSIGAILKIKTIDAVQVAVDHALGMLHLGRSDMLDV